MKIHDAKFAIIHDWFIKKSFGGAEKVTLLINELLNDNYSSPDLFALTSNLGKDNKLLINKNIKTSFIQSLPFGKNNIQNFLPIIPFAIEQMNLNDYDIVISSSHAFAKGVITSPNQCHISYLHTPMRYAWDQMHTYLKQSNLKKYGLDLLLRYFLFKLRQWDFYSSQRIDYLISNSNFTARRVKKYWGLESEVIHPPVDIDRFEYTVNRSNFYLSVNRLVPNKRIDLLIRSFNKLNLPLIIIGDGPERIKLEKIAKPNIKFLGKLSDIDVENYMSRCRAFVYAGVEDFGIAPVEAMASGAPIIAYSGGGILDTVNCLSTITKDKISNGLLFKSQTVEDIFDTVNWFEDKKLWKNFDPEILNQYAKKFSYKNFKNKFEISINKAWDIFQRKF